MEFPPGPLLVLGYGTSTRGDTETAESRAIFEIARSGIQTFPISNPGVDVYEMSGVTGTPATLRGVVIIPAERQAAGLRSAPRRAGLNLAGAHRPFTWM